MKAEKLKQTIMEVTKLNPDGFTFNPTQNRFLSKGYAVATNVTQDCLGKAGLFRVVKFCLKNRDYCIGGWKNEDGTLQFDASKIYYSLEEAVKAAIMNKQRALYNLYTGKEIKECDYYRYLDYSAIVA